MGVTAKLNKDRRQLRQLCATLEQERPPLGDGGAAGVTHMTSIVALMRMLGGSTSSLQYDHPERGCRCPPSQSDA